MLGRPTKVDLDRIIGWKFTDSVNLIEFVKSIWQIPGKFNINGTSLQVSTGKIADNEQMIKALKANQMFWHMCWQQSVRGGYYVFDITPCILAAKDGVLERQSGFRQ